MELDDPTLYRAQNCDCFHQPCRLPGRTLLTASMTAGCWAGEGCRPRTTLRPLTRAGSLPCASDNQSCLSRKVTLKSLISFLFMDIMEAFLLRQNCFLLHMRIFHTIQMLISLPFDNGFPKLEDGSTFRTGLPTQENGSVSRLIFSTLVSENMRHRME